MPKIARGCYPFHHAERKIMILYHVTDVENLDSIAEEGLVPMIGRLSEKLGESVPRTYFFVSRDDTITGLMNWLGEEFDEIDEQDGYEHKHVTLECRVEDSSIDDSFFEVSLDYVVLPEDIRITRDSGLMPDFDYDEDFIAGYPALSEWD